MSEVFTGVEEVRRDFPDFKAGDTIKVYIKVKEADKERVQSFQGVVIAIRGKGNGKTFTVRKVSFGIGVERIFPFASPSIEKIEIVKKGKVRRAKLYYLRKLKGKAARLKEEI